MARNRRKRIKIRSVHTPLRLTSMMDILTVLLLFLLKSFVVEGEVITPMAGVELPESSSDSTPEASLVIAIFDDAIMMDSELIAHVSTSLDGGLLIESLADRLDDARAQAEGIARRRGNEDEFVGRIAIQGDRNIRFDILQRVMYTCNAVGFENISLAVVGTS